MKTASDFTSLHKQIRAVAEGHRSVKSIVEEFLEHIDQQETQIQAWSYLDRAAILRKTEELDGCYDESPGDERTALFRIDVIEIPVKDPSKSKKICF